MGEGYEDLRGRTKTYAFRVIKMFSMLPKSVEAQILGRQVLRSGTSVGANYREAYRARSHVEFTAKIGDCLKELEETCYWLELLSGSGIIPADKLAPLQDETNQLIAIFVTILKSSRANKNVHGHTTRTE